MQLRGKIQQLRNKTEKLAKTYFLYQNIVFGCMSHNVLGWRRFFVPDKEKCEAFLPAQKNVAETKPHKGRSPTAVLWTPNRPNRAVSSYRLLCDGQAYTIFTQLLFYIYWNKRNYYI
jgi:hypothetical protein